MLLRNKKLLVSLIIGLMIVTSSVIFLYSKSINSNIDNKDSKITFAYNIQGSQNLLNKSQNLAQSTDSNKTPNSTETKKEKSDISATTLSSNFPILDIKVTDLTPAPLQPSEPKPKVVIEPIPSANEEPKLTKTPQQKPTNSESFNPDISKFKIFDGNDWKNIFESAKNNYSNTTMNYSGLNYFGDAAVNQVVIDLATKRGFIKREMVTDQSQLVYLEGLPIQPQAADALRAMFAEMRAQGHSIVFLSGFRGIEEQSRVFGDEFYKQSINSKGREISNAEILNGDGNDAINRSYDTVALPGYSRHHFGYTVDLTESGTYYKDFSNTGSYEWMSKDNFYNIKKYGIIPSYPKGVEAQGPEPESWEFVYVGRDILLK